MAITKQFGNLATPPSDYFEFGEGSFTLWYHNTTLNGDVDEPSSSQILTTHDTTYGQWAVVPPGGSWIKGNAYTFFNSYDNTNDVTFTFPGSDFGTNLSLQPSFIESIVIQYTATSTAGSRYIEMKAKPFGSSNVTEINLAEFGASKRVNIILTSSGACGIIEDTYGSGYHTIVMPIPFQQPYGGTIQWSDVADRDDNDDQKVTFYTSEAIHKFKRLDFHNCKNFGTTYVGSAGYQYSSNGRNQVAWVSKYGDDQPIEPKVWVNK
tara:strand:+ start:151 stop:945 length:795 start_codon:yes stop_codon:yes gene_type:complete